MCVIVHNRPNSRNLTREEFNKCWATNRDGYGLMYAKDWVVEVRKSMELDESYELYLEAMRTAPEGNVVSHFRYKTHWPISKDNVHPFPCGLDESMWVMHLVHNWVLGYTSKENPSWSDTRILATWLQRCPKGYHKLAPFQEMINKQLSWDKVLIMDTTWHVEYFGDEGIMVDDGIWASNWAPVIYKKQVVADCCKTNCKSISNWVTTYTVNWKDYTVGKFYKLPEKSDETDNIYFYKGELFFDEFMIDEDGMVIEYQEKEELTV